MNARLRSIVDTLSGLFRETAPAPEQMAARLRLVERDVVLPVKGVLLLLLFYHLFVASWFENVTLPQTDAQLGVRKFFVLYLLFNIAVAVLLIRSKQTLTPLAQRFILASNFTDGLMLAALAYMTGGVQSISYWLFLSLIVRNALSCPLAAPQLQLNVSCCFCYMAASLSDWLFSRSVSDLDDLTRAPGEDGAKFPLEAFALRMLVLGLVTGWCYVMQVLFEKQRRAAEEAQEFAVRQEQLRAAGKLAGKIAHQIKNPLGIINNAAYSLGRALREGKPANPQQVEIIREEVERADQTITQLMGYARLAEGKVERIEVAEEIDRALELALPAAANYPVEVQRDYADHLPRLMMQRIHISEALVNLINNAREAFVGGRGCLKISAHTAPDQSVIITIADDGPGISKTKLNDVFQPFFTTKAKGTGLGLPIVKHNAELYGGTVHVESELGKGTRFILQFPTRTIMKPAS